MGNVWVLTFWLVVSTAPASAADPAADLKSALKKYRNVESLMVDFEQVKTLKDMNFQLKSQGQMSLRPPNKITWHIKNPVPLKFELDVEDPNSPIPDPQRRELAQMITWLRMDADALTMDYQVKKILPEGSFEFSPKDKSSVFKTLRLTLQNGFADSVTLEENSGDRIDLKFLKPTLKYKMKYKK